ncbi:MAG: hypothetical protein ABIT20_02495 [Gemmatimonadaceae bacterium]
MPHEIRLHTQHPAVQTLVGRWLSEARLALPAPVDLVVDVAPLAEPAGDPRPIFSQGRVIIRTGPPENTVAMQWGPGLGRTVLTPGNTTAHVTITEEGLAESNELLRSFLLNVCIFLVRRVGLHHVHAATLRDPMGRGWLLVGESGSGKSTTTVLLARNGWGVGTDDIAFLTAGDTPGTTDMIGWREQLALRDDAVEAMGGTGGTALSTRKKTGWFAEELDTTWVSRVTPELIGFPTVSTSDTTSVAPLSARNALTRLMTCSPWVMLEPDLADEHLGLMSRLVKQSRAFEITLGRDLFDRPELLLELVA